MKKSLLFIGIVVTSIVMLFAANAANSFPKHSTHNRYQTARSVLLYQIPEPGLPINDPLKGNTPFFKESPSFTAQSSTFLIRLPQHATYYYPPLFEEQNVDNWDVGEPSVRHDLRMTLFRVAINPNAP
jgi:hypothetical protein